MSVLIWAIPAPGTLGVSLGVEISDSGLGGPEDERIWVIAERGTVCFRQERKESQCGQYLRNGHEFESREAGACSCGTLKVRQRSQ